MKKIAALFAGSGIGFVDAGIIGGPPREGYDPVFYASAAPEASALLDEFSGLAKYGLKVSPLRGEGAGVGDASALKMSYAVGAHLPSSLNQTQSFNVGHLERHHWPDHDHDTRYVSPATCKPSDLMSCT